MIPDDRELNPRETKAIRLVREHRVHVGWVSLETGDTEIPVAGAGKVDGDTDTYLVSYSPHGRICTCPAGANHRPCSHSMALELAVAARGHLQLELIV